jgi:DnaK suppressor protein
MTQVATITAGETARRRAALEAKLVELMGGALGREELQIEKLADPLDQIKSSTDREMAVQRLNHQSRLVSDVQTALAAIDEGTYGVCEDCEEAIPRKRLDAVPWARLCVPCQSKVEAEARRDGLASLSDAA